MYVGGRDIYFQNAKTGLLLLAGTSLHRCLACPRSLSLTLKVSDLSRSHTLWKGHMFLHVSLHHMPSIHLV